MHFLRTTAAALGLCAALPAQADWTRTIAPDITPGGLAYDSQRGVFYYVRSDGDFFQEALETWEWDGASWRLVASSSATGGMAGAATTYDSARQQLVKFGGFDGNGGLSAETWLWNGAAWALSPATGPWTRTS